MLAWILGLLAVAAFGYAAWRAHGKWLDREHAAEARMASFVAQAKATAPAARAPAPQPAPAAVPRAETAGPERLLFEAADRAGQAGEPALSIQLYARLISRYPQSALVAVARGAVAEQKKNLAKA